MGGMVVPCHDSYVGMLTRSTSEWDLITNRVLSDVIDELTLEWRAGCDPTGREALQPGGVWRQAHARRGPVQSKAGVPAMLPQAEEPQGLGRSFLQPQKEPP